MRVNEVGGESPVHSHIPVGRSFICRYYMILLFTRPMDSKKIELAMHRGFFFIILSLYFYVNDKFCSR